MFGRESEQQTPLSTPSHSRGESQSSTSQPQTTETMKDILEPEIPTQGLGNELLVGHGTLPSNSLPNLATPLNQMLQAAFSILLLLLHCLYGY
ncbi:hypothetical protein AMECASPLE_020241 [Ameca splendens]|uniref:Uncharacterized protein n=1 Tax=Ameca splendens TaxID=208324 RepID=A0ABV0ZYY4_9TELE